MDSVLIEKLAKELLQAERERCPIDPITARYSPITIQDAYRIQLETIKMKEKEGCKVVGKKIGLTSMAMQEMFDVREPDYGCILDSLICSEWNTVDTFNLIQPKIEAEIAFVLNEDLKGPGVNVAKVLKATEGIIPALEVIDSRIKNWKIKICDTIADNASIGRVILGARMTAVKDLDLRLIGLVFKKNGVIASTSSGAAVLGNPAQAVTWLANKLSEYNVSLKQGDLILSGSLIPAVDIKSGDSVEAEFDRIGSVSAYFK